MVEYLKTLGDEPFELDETDVQLLAALQADGAASLASLGEVVDLSAPAVMERVRKMEQAGVIKGYAALIDARKVGLDIAAFIGVSMAYPKRIAEFEQWVKSEPQILECHHMTGAWTLLLKARCRNTAALEKLISAIRLLDSVDRTETMVVLSTNVERVELPLATALADTAPRRVRRTKRRSA